MKSFLNIASVLASVVALTVADACEPDDVTSSVPVVADTAAHAVTDISSASASSTSAIPAAPTSYFGPVLNPHIDTANISFVHPQANITMYYASNLTAASSMKINHTMKYPTVMLEQIAAVTLVDCTADSVAVTFNDSTVFEITEASWASQGTFVMVTNHLGECDPELERGFFIVDSISFDNTTLVATASSAGTNISATAAKTTISFGSITSSTISNSTSKRGLTTTLDPSYTIDTTLALPADTSIYSYAPYLSVTADTASFTGDVTFSGYLEYNWLSIKIEKLYFDIDAGFFADLALSAEVGASYSDTFSYAPTALFYGVSVPGILELGPQLQFGVNAFVSASAEVTLTTELTAGLTDGNVHLDLLDSALTTTSGWAPTYSAKVNISGEAKAELNPAATLTVEIAINFFGGLLDLSTGLTAAPGFNNSLILTGAAGVDVAGVDNLTSNGTCNEGLELISEFVFSVKAFATQWFSTTLYSVDIPLLDECYSWA